VDTIEIGGSIRAIAIDRGSGALFLALNLSTTPTSNCWGGAGEGAGTFSTQVLDLELDARGRVYVADGKNYLIQVFEPR